MAVKKLNSSLKKTIAYKLLSDLGKRIYFPPGIASQAAEAARRADSYNCSVGMAYKNGIPLILPSIQKEVPDIPPGNIVGYAPTSGDEKLRYLWQKEMKVKNRGSYDPDISLPVVVSGITNGISLVADLFVDKNNPVIIPEPYWDNYNLIFRSRRQAKIITPSLFEKNKLNISGIKKAVKNNKRNNKIVFILNFPNNPTGYTPTKTEAEELQNSIKKLADGGLNILIIIDDAYSGFCYEKDLWIESLFFLFSNLHENVLAVKVDGATKENYAWGLRIGFVTFGSKNLSNEHYQVLNEKLSAAIRSSISNSSRIAQTLLASAIESRNYANDKKKYFHILYERYLEVGRVLKQMNPESPLTPLPFNSGYFMSFKIREAGKLRKFLLHKKNIGTIAINDSILRLAYSSIDTDKIEEVLAAIFSGAEEY